jgi:ATP synthase protein I
LDEGRFDQRLEEARKRAGLGAPSAPSTPVTNEPHPLTFAFRLGVEMVASVAVACAIGYGLDRLFGTRPWIMVAFVPLGVAAGVRSLMRSVSPAGKTGV